MQKLAGIDAAFLYLETQAAHMHVTGTIVLDPITMPQGRNVDHITEFVTERLRSLPVFRKRVLEVPFGLGHPVCVDDPRFDHIDHIRRATVPAPGSGRDLAKLIGRIAGKRLDRNKPLWEMWVLDGLANGHVALVTKIHHALIDGVAGAAVMSHLFDLEPEASPRALVEADTGEPVPTTMQLVTQALASLTTKPARIAQTVVETGRSLMPLLGGGDKEDTDSGPRATLPFNAPRTVFSGSISPERAVAFGRAPLDDIKRVKNAFGVTVNDVVLGACTMALRGYLAESGELPDRPLVATIPVSLDPAASDRQEGNSVSAMFVSLPVHVPDPVIQLLRISRDTRKAKKRHGSVSGNMLGEWMQHMPSALVSQGARLYAKLADHVRPIHNLVISNVPGPAFPLYAAGARVVATYPLGPVLDGAAVNMTVLSYQGSVDLGVISCREAVPDPWRIAERFEEAVAELLSIAELEAGNAASTDLALS